MAARKRPRPRIHPLVEGQEYVDEPKPKPKRKAKRRGRRSVAMAEAVPRATPKSKETKYKPESHPYKSGLSAVGGTKLAKKVLDVAYERVRDLPNVLSVGLGRPYSEKKKKYRKGHDKLGGLGVIVYVSRKQMPKDRDKVIPKTIQVTYGKHKYRILTDVVVIASAEAQAQEGRDWPTAGDITPGRIFGYVKDPAAPADTTEPPESTIEIGTCGAAVRLAGATSMYVATAGHVLTTKNLTNLARPADKGWYLTKFEGSWDSVSKANFFPITLARPNDGVFDAMMSLIPSPFRPDDSTNIWPKGFKGTIATRTDVKNATTAGGTNGFVWVEREKQQLDHVEIPINLREFADVLPVRIAGRWIRYVGVFRYTFPNGPAEETIGGDSGSPIFLKRASGQLVLLGLHVVGLANSAGLCESAKDFFGQMLEGAQGTDWNFVGFPLPS